MAATTRYLYCGRADRGRGQELLTDHRRLVGSQVPQLILTGQQYLRWRRHPHTAAFCRSAQLPPWAPARSPINGGSLGAGNNNSTVTVPNPEIWNGDFHEYAVSSPILTGRITLAGTRTVILDNMSTFSFTGAISDGGNGYGLSFAGGASHAAVSLGGAQHLQRRHHLEHHVYGTFSSARSPTWATSASARASGRAPSRSAPSRTGEGRLPSTIPAAPPAPWPPTTPRSGTATSPSPAPSP